MQKKKTKGRKYMHNGSEPHARDLFAVRQRGLVVIGDGGALQRFRTTKLFCSQLVRKIGLDLEHFNGERCVPGEMFVYFIKYSLILPMFHRSIYKIKHPINLLALRHPYNDWFCASQGRLSTITHTYHTTNHAAINVI